MQNFNLTTNPYLIKSLTKVSQAHTMETNSYFWPFGIQNINDCGYILNILNSNSHL